METGDRTRREQSVGYCQLRLRGTAPAQHVQLMPQHDDLGLQPRLRLERRDHDMENQTQERDHCESACPILPLMPARMEYSVRTGSPFQCGRLTAATQFTNWPRPGAEPVGMVSPAATHPPLGTMLAEPFMTRLSTTAKKQDPP